MSTEDDPTAENKNHWEDQEIGHDDDDDDDDNDE